MRGKVWAMAAVSGLMLAGCGTSPVSSSVNVPDTMQVVNVENQVISVTAREEVKVVPDIAEVMLTVETQEADAKACQTSNGEAVDRVVTVLKEKGLEDSSIQTSNYDLNPIYDWDNGQQITGYSMETMITVSDIPIENVGDILSASVDAGANRIQSVTYMSSKYDESYQEALKKAVESAYEKANAMAIAGGCSLGEVVRIDERSVNSGARYTAMGNFAVEDAEAGGAREAASAVMPGQVSVEADILVEYAVNR